MKIDVNGAYRAYTKNSLPQQRPGLREEKETATQQDRVSFSASAHKNEIDRTVYSAAAEVEATGSPARISELKQAVASGQYSIPAEKLADAILDTYI